MYRALDPDKIAATAEALRIRVSERFPEASLAKVAADLEAMSSAMSATARWLSAPYWPVRTAVGTGLLLLLGAALGAVFALDLRVAAFSSLADLFQGIDAAINDVVFIGLAVFFLTSWEQRIKRKRAQRVIHELRSLAHVVDMHQLTKDPERLAGHGSDTQSSPVRRMSAFELTRYLDYCSEMLSIISKLAALLVQNFQDPVTVTAVNEIEDLTSGMSRKIWQKIIILDRIMGPAGT